MMSSLLDSSLCSNACATGQSSLAQIPRVAFDWTGIYVDPATSAALTGLVYMLYSSGKFRMEYLCHTVKLLKWISRRIRSTRNAIQ
jgi:hypothetical protein